MWLRLAVGRSSLRRRSVPLRGNKTVARSDAGAGILDLARILLTLDSISPPARGRRGPRRPARHPGNVFRATLLAGLLCVPLLVLTGSSLAASPTTIVSLEFDDGTDNQYQVLSMLQSRGMVGTFFIISGNVGKPGSMTSTQVSDLAAAGDEVAGHTIDHVGALTDEPVSEQEHQICDGRAALAKMGFQVYDFAYPEGAANSATEGLVQNCGFNSGRIVGNIQSPKSCGGCPYAESIPPDDPYATRTPDSVVTSTSLADLESEVTNAENNGGGWVQFVIHNICSSSDPCDPTYNVDPTLLGHFLDWLKTSGALVETVHQVVGGSLQPVVSTDSTPPTVSLTAPADGATVSGSVTVSAERGRRRGARPSRFLCRLD